MAPRPVPQRVSAELRVVERFLAVAAGVFFLVVRPYNAYQAKQPAEEPAGPAEDIRLLTEIRDALKAGR